MTTQYVLGFLFHGPYVALINKRRGPDVVIGKWNGIGGHIEETDHHKFAAMEREFGEETGVRITAQGWMPVCSFTMDRYDALIHVMSAAISVQHNRPVLAQTTDEPVQWHRWGYLSQIDCVPNLHWLIGLCNDPDRPNQINF